MRLILPIALALCLTAPALAQDKVPPPATTDAKTVEKPAAEAQKADTEKAETSKSEAPAEASKPAPEKPEVTKNDDWFVGCRKITVEGKTVKVCEMQQILEETSTGQAFIRISVIYPRGSTKPVLRILTPLGVLLQKGIAIKIDDAKPITLPFAICVGKPPSCIVDGIMEDSIVSAMKRGNAGTLTLSFGNNQVVEAPFSLTGFTKSIKSIEPE